MSVYDVYIRKHGKDYYEKLHLHGSEEQFAALAGILERKWRKHLIDEYYMFELDPEGEEEDEEDD